MITITQNTTHPVGTVGYAQEFSGLGRHWQTSPAEEWDIVVHTPHEIDIYLGTRKIDGYRYNVWLCEDGKYRAQLVK